MDKGVQFSANNFAIPSFDELTNTIVTGWVEGNMGEEEVANLKSALDSKITEEITPTTETKTIGE